MHRLVVIICLSVLSGCTALQSPRPAASSSTVDAGAHEELGELLRQHAQRWLDTPYRFGGVSHHGVDCSGLIQRVYADALGVALPRTTAAQIREGRRVRPGRSLPGDLVFFEPDGKGSHAGIVLGDNEFLHASSSRGVMISPLDHGYWSQYVVTARRILAEEDVPLILSRYEKGAVGVPDLTIR